METAETRVARFPLNNESEDAATVVTLASGAYTVEVKGKDDAAGIVLVPRPGHESDPVSLIRGNLGIASDGAPSAWQPDGTTR